MGWISLQSKGLSRVFSTPQFKSINSSALSFLHNPTGYGRIIRDNNEDLLKIVEQKDANEQEKAVNEINSGIYCFNGKSLKEALNNINNRLVITFLPRSKRLLISWLQSPSAVILEPPKNKV